MGYRGSKSITGFYTLTSLKPVIVKEQRVDGSWRKRNSLSFKVYSNGSRKKLSSQNPFLANIFKGFSINFVRNVSTLPVRQLKLHPYFVTGFCDYLQRESYFSISISKSSKMKTG